MQKSKTAKENVKKKKKKKKTKTFAFVFKSFAHATSQRGTASWLDS